MKTPQFSILLIILAIMSLASCKKDDGLTPNPDGTTTPIADFSYAGANLPAPTTISFTNSSTNATSYSWDFGDNATSTATNPTHRYATGGVYTVRLTATGPSGSNSITKTVNIQAAPTICRITSIQLTAMPFTDASGVGWDPFDGPDVFIKITNSAGGVLADGTSERVSNIALSNLPITWNLSTPISISPLNTDRNILVYDFDSLDPDDYIGGVGFNPSTSVTGYPANVTLTYQGVSVILGLQWQ